MSMPPPGAPSPGPPILEPVEPVDPIEPAPTRPSSSRPPPNRPPPTEPSAPPVAADRTYADTHTDTDRAHTDSDARAEVTAFVAAVVPTPEHAVAPAFATDRDLEPDPLDVSAAPMIGQHPQPPLVSSTDPRDALLGYLQQASRAGNDLREYLLALDAEPTDPLRLVRVDEVADRVLREVDGYLAHADALLDPAGMRRWSGDSVTHIRNVWAAIASERHRLDRAPHAPARHLAVVELVRLIDDAGSAAGWITIPPRINDHLANIAVGEELDFDALFADEIPDPDLRAKLFDALARNTLLLTGYCDTETRRITRISPSRARQWVSIMVTVAVAAACAAALALVNQWADAPGLPPLDRRLATGTVVISVVIVWVGTLSHFALSWYKGYRSNDLRVPRSATRVLFWINSKEVALWGAVVTGAVLTGVFALTRTVDQPAALLAIGYSFDSIADALFPRFESRMVQLAGALPGPART